MKTRHNPPVQPDGRVGRSAPARARRRTAISLGGRSQMGASATSEQSTIYMPLLDEGVDVWRPVPAERLSADRYLVAGVVPTDESWQFVPGSVVRCEEHVFASGERRLVAVENVPTAG